MPKAPVNQVWFEEDRKEIARLLVEEGYTMRELAIQYGVSYQRIAQLSQPYAGNLLEMPLARYSPAKDKDTLKDVLATCTSLVHASELLGTPPQSVISWIKYHNLDLPDKNEFRLRRLFKKKILKKEGHWIWQGCTHLGRPRVSHEQYGCNFITDYLWIRSGRKILKHTSAHPVCGEPLCVNPDHLQLKHRYKDRKPRGTSYDSHRIRPHQKN